MANKADLVRNRQVKAAGKLKSEVLTEYSIPFYCFCFCGKERKIESCLFLLEILNHITNFGSQLKANIQ